MSCNHAYPCSQLLSVLLYCNHAYPCSQLLSVLLYCCFWWHSVYIQRWFLFLLFSFWTEGKLIYAELRKLHAYLHLDRVKSFMSTYAHKVLAYTTLLNTIYKAKQPSRYLSTRMASKSRGDSERWHLKKETADFVNVVVRPHLFLNVK